MAVTIRVAKESDAAAVAAIYAPSVRETAISFEVDPPSEEEMQRRIRETLSRWPWLVCDRDGEVLGYAYASQHRARAAYQWSADVSVYIHADARRCGVGSALYAPLLEIVRQQGFYNAYGGITLPNAGSVGLHESFGFQPVGIYRAVGFKLGVWHDVGWWHLALQRHEPPKAPPTPFPNMAASPEVQRALDRGSEKVKVKS